MTSEQATQIAQITFFAILVVPALITLGGCAVVIWVLVPRLLAQSQQLTDNNAELTKVVKQNSDQIASIQTPLSGIVPELTKQTAAIEAQTAEIRGQGFDFKSYQTLVSDGMTLQTSAIEANTATSNALSQSLANLPSQIVQAIKDELACQTILNELSTLRAEVTRAIFQQQRATGTFPVVPPPPSSLPPNGSATP